MRPRLFPALDLDPHFRLALVGRADSFVRLERWSPLSGYEPCLAINPKQPLVLANRAGRAGASWDSSKKPSTGPEQRARVGRRKRRFSTRIALRPGPNWGASRRPKRISVPSAGYSPMPRRSRSKKSSPEPSGPIATPTVETTRGGAPRWRTRLRSRVDCPQSLPQPRCRIVPVSWRC